MAFPCLGTEKSQLPPAQQGTEQGGRRGTGILTAHLHDDVQDFTLLKAEEKKCLINSKSNAQNSPASSTPILSHSHLVLEAPRVLVAPVGQKNKKRSYRSSQSYLWCTQKIPCQTMQSYEKPLGFPVAGPCTGLAAGTSACLQVLHGGGRRRSTSTCAMHIQVGRQ